MEMVSVCAHPVLSVFSSSLAATSPVTSRMNWTSGYVVSFIAIFVVNNYICLDLSEDK